MSDCAGYSGGGVRGCPGRAFTSLEIGGRRSRERLSDLQSGALAMRLMSVRLLDRQTGSKMQRGRRRKRKRG